jgi:hypothetical protein
MSDTELLETQLPSTPASQPGRATEAELPEDLLREATERLSILALVWAGLFAFGILMNDVIAPLLDMSMDDLIPWGRPGDIVAVVSIGVSLWLWRYTRRLTCRPRQALDLALVYQVFLALGIGIINQWEPQRVLAGRLSWLCVLILLFPMIVPNTPRKTLIASILVASMDPAGLLVAKARGRIGRHVQRARELGSYRLVHLIGRGGMGEVWHATHRMLARPAAIKLIKPEILGTRNDRETSAVTQRFRREAEAASCLQSPHTIRLYDFGETRAGTFYFAMELLDGLDLETLVRRHGPLPPERVIHLLRQACHSLGEAHDCGLIHRDVKPANIYLCRLGREYDFVKVLDFGLVKYDHDESLLDTMKGTADLTTGTPAYMAPEMASGDAVDRRADLYALGCVAYWLLTGELVFSAESPLKMLIQHIQAVPVPPSIRSGRPVPPGLERLIMRCLEKDPASRPATADELLAELERVELESTWGPVLARTWWEEHIAATEPSRRSGGRPLLAVG